MKNYQSAAKAMDELTLELIQRGITIPRHVTDDLKSGRSYANISSSDPDNSETAMEAMIALERVEMNLLALAEIEFGREKAEMWQHKINSAYRDEIAQRPPSRQANRFGSGMPKGDHWIRVQSDYMDTALGARESLEGCGLSLIKQDDGFLLIHGRKEDISAFLKGIRKKNRKAGI